MMRYCAHGSLGPMLLAWPKLHGLAKISLGAHPEQGTVPVAHCRQWPGRHRLAGGEVRRGGG
jgi:hypothetical protein